MIDAGSQLLMLYEKVPEALGLDVVREFFYDGAFNKECLKNDRARKRPAAFTWNLFTP